MSEVSLAGNTYTAQRREYRSRPEVKAHYSEYYQEYYQKPDIKIRRQVYEKTYQKQYRDNPVNKLRMSEYGKKYRQVRLRLIILLGGRCNCGYSDTRALELDHINGGGGKERKKKGNGSYGEYRYYLDHLDEARLKYQVLCRNCNWIKKCENHEC